MLPSAGLTLLALLRRIRSIRNTLKPFILRCLRFLPHAIRSLRHILSLFSGRTGTDPKDVLKKKGDYTRPSYPRAPGVREEYSAICASRDFNRAGEPHLGADDAGSQSVPPSPTTSLAPSSLGPDRLFPGSSSFIPGDNIQIPLVPLLSTPLTLTHSRSTSRHFAGAPRQSRSRSRSRSRSPQSLRPGAQQSPATSSDHSRPPSPSPLQLLFPQPLPLPELSLPDSSRRTHFPYGEGYRLPQINVRPPSRAQTSVQTAESPQPLSLNRMRLSFPSEETDLDSDMPRLTDSGDWSDGKRRSIALMHSEQVSRYVSKGVV